MSTFESDADDNGNSETQPQQCCTHCEHYNKIEQKAILKKMYPRVLLAERISIKNNF